MSWGLLSLFLRPLCDDGNRPPCVIARRHHCLIAHRRHGVSCFCHHHHMCEFFVALVVFVMLSVVVFAALEEVTAAFFKDIVSKASAIATMPNRQQLQWCRQHNHCQLGSWIYVAPMLHSNAVEPADNDMDVNFISSLSRISWILLHRNHVRCMNVNHAL